MQLKQTTWPCHILTMWLTTTEISYQWLEDPQCQGNLMSVFSKQWATQNLRGYTWCRGSIKINSAERREQYYFLIVKVTGGSLKNSAIERYKKNIRQGMNSECEKLHVWKWTGRSWKSVKIQTWFQYVNVNQSREVYLK